MQRRKSSRIVSSDFPTLGGRNQGTYILQEHGIDVVRGDLITQDNIIPDPYEPQIFTITIDKDNYTQLCTMGSPGSLISYTTDAIAGSFTSDANGIYGESFGSGGSYHGPLMYIQLPSQIGISGQYWYLSMRITVSSKNGSAIVARAGYSTYLRYDDSDSRSVYSQYSLFQWMYNSTTNNLIYRYDKTPSSNVTHTLKVYHYPNNTIKMYRDQTLVYNAQDPIPLDKGDNILIIQTMQVASNPVAYNRIHEVTISTDPTYDPQP